MNNGITLCEECHNSAIHGSIHNIYGTRDVSPETLEKYINDINDYHILGTAILFLWRDLTHWTYSYSILNNEEMPDAREWFIIAFTRLADINNEMINEGKLDSWCYVKK